MTAGTLSVTYEFSAAGLELATSAIVITDGSLKIAHVEKTGAIRLTVTLDGATQARAEALSDRVAAEFYRRLLLRHGAPVRSAAPPLRIQTVFTPSGAAGPSTNTATICPNAIIAPSPPTGVPAPDVEAILRDSHARAITPQVATSAQLYAAIDMYVAAVESGNAVVRFLVLYSALSLAALFKWHSGRQARVDELITTANPGVRIFTGTGKNNSDETLYTKLRNDLIHAEERRCDPARAIQEIQVTLEAFQRDAASVLLSL